MGWIYLQKEIWYIEKQTASITLGLGVKTEGNLVISGTRGYVLVPSPWWLTNYFEVRYEDQNQNKKYFYTYQGDGLRYELQEFLSMIIYAPFKQLPATTQRVCDDCRIDRIV